MLDCRAQELETQRIALEKSERLEAELMVEVVSGDEQSAVGGEGLEGDGLLVDECFSGGTGGRNGGRG